MHVRSSYVGCLRILRLSFGIIKLLIDWVIDHSVHVSEYIGPGEDRSSV